MRKLFYLIKHATWFTRIVAIIALVAAIFMIVTVSNASKVAMDTPVTDLPGITTLTEYVPDAKPIVDGLEEKFGPMTLNEMKDSIKDTVAEEVDEEKGAMVETVFKVISIYATVIIVAMILATVFMKKGLMILAFILAVPYSLVFVGMSGIVSMAIALVAYFILMTIVNKKYKAYKKSK